MRLRSNGRRLPISVAFVAVVVAAAALGLHFASAETKEIVWSADEKLNGITTEGRYTVNLTSPDAYNFKSEVRKPNGGWATVMEGTATRVPPPSQ